MLRRQGNPRVPPLAVDGMRRPAGQLGAAMTAHVVTYRGRRITNDEADRLEAIRPIRLHGPRPAALSGATCASAAFDACATTDTRGC